MSERKFSCITIRALLRMYGVSLRPLPDGRWIGHHPLSMRSDSALILSADGSQWSTNDRSPLCGDRLDFVMHMECVTRARATELLHDEFPAVLEREGIREEG